MSIKFLCIALMMVGHVISRDWSTSHSFTEEQLKKLESCKDGCPEEHYHCIAQCASRHV